METETEKRSFSPSGEPQNPSHQSSQSYKRTGKYINDKRFIIFQRLLRFLPRLNVLAGLTTSASIGALTFNEFHPTTRSLNYGAEGLLMSCAISATVSFMLSIMIQFRFESYKSLLKKDYVLMWMPLILLDWSIVALLLGLTLWYADKNPGWRAVLMAFHVGLLLGFGIWVACRMGMTMLQVIEVQDGGSSENVNISHLDIVGERDLS